MSCGVVVMESDWLVCFGLFLEFIMVECIVIDCVVFVVVFFGGKLMVDCVLIVDGLVVIWDVCKCDIEIVVISVIVYLIFNEVDVGGFDSVFCVDLLLCVEVDCWVLVEVIVVGEVDVIVLDYCFILFDDKGELFVMVIVGMLVLEILFVLLFVFVYDEEFSLVEVFCLFMVGLVDLLGLL